MRTTSRDLQSMFDLFCTMLSILIVAASGCGGNNTSADGCISGQQINCACGNNVDGYQVCSGDGSSYGPCQCPSSTSTGGSAASGGSTGGTGVGGSNTTSSSTTSSTTTMPPTCNGCMSQYCADLESACAQDSACQSADNCFQGCKGQPDCAYNCDQNIAGADFKLIARESCRAYYCDALCTGTDPSCGASVLGLLAGEGCYNCDASQCCKEGLLCGMSVECWHAIQCLNGGQQNKCPPTAKGCSLQAAIIECQNTKCSGAGKCGNGPPAAVCQ